MDEATLTIRFKDESSPGPAGVATTSPQYSGSDPGSVKVADQQNAITQAGGVGAMAEKNSRASSGGPAPVVAAPVPPAAALPVPSMASPAQASGDPLLPTVRGLVQADPSVTAAEIAKALGINQRQAQTLINAATVQPGGQQSPAPSAPLPVPPASPAPVPPATALPPVPAPPVAPPPVAATAPQQTAGTPQAPPVQNQPAQPGQPQQQGPDASHGVQSAVNTIAGIAAQGGPLGAAAGRAASAAAAVPGIGASLAGAAPGLAAAAPFIAAGAAALAVPVAGALVLRSIADTARGQISGLSPEAAQAEAQANVRQLVANMMTARRLGDEVADYVENRSRIGAASQGLRDVIAEPALKDLNNSLRLLRSFLEEANKEPDENAKAAETGWKTLKALFGATTGLGGLLDMASDWGAKLKDTDAAKLGRDNPLYFYQNLPMPKLPAPFYETDETPIIDRGFGGDMSSMPGLSF